MYLTKQRIYLYFNKTQKSTLCSFLRSFVKRYIENTADVILEKFIEEEEYYLKLNILQFPFIEDKLQEKEFLNETLEYIKACKKYYEYKKENTRQIMKQKEFERKKRRFLQELKMSKEQPTQKQIYYYSRLCKKYGIKEKSTDSLSKLDLKKEIESIMDEYSRDYQNIDR